MGEVLCAAMGIRLAIAAGSVCTLWSFPAFADESSTTPGPPRIGVQAQLELLTRGSATYMQAAPPLTVDFDTAYAISGMLDYALTSFLRVGVAPRLILHVKDAGSPTNSANRAVDVRARIRAHYTISGLELYAAFLPGYEVILLTDSDRDGHYDGWALGGAVGATYHLSPTIFIGSEIGYQVAYNAIDPSDTWKLSYMHIGLNAETRF